MSIKEENIRLIFGLKLRRYRIKAGLSSAELAKRCGLSPSYLTEIEKGKKHPKPEKIMSLARELEVEYEELLSLNLEKGLMPVEELLHSNALQNLPLELFGLDPSSIIELVSHDPIKISAFISTIVEIARNYEMSQESFYHSALRSYQELHENYFEDLEKEAKRFLEEVSFNVLGKKRVKNLSSYLEETHGYEIVFRDFQKPLEAIRSTYVPEKNQLLINQSLSESQISFILAREIAFNFLSLNPRPYTFSWLKVDSFELLLNNFKASYLAGAILMPEDEFVDDFKGFLASPKWKPDTMKKQLAKYRVSSETYFHRLTNLLSPHFGIESFFFLRFVNDPRTEKYFLTKEMHISRLHNPHGNLLDEHYCRRWITIGLLQKLKQSDDDELIFGAQVSTYHDSTDSYLCLSMAKRTRPGKDSNASLTLGMLLNPGSKRKIKFLEDKNIIHREVNATCERCPISDCEERVAPPREIRKRDTDTLLENALKKLAT